MWRLDKISNVDNRDKRIRKPQQRGRGYLTRSKNKSTQQVYRGLRGKGNKKPVQRRKTAEKGRHTKNF